MMKKIKKFLSSITIITILLSFCISLNTYAASTSAFEKEDKSVRQLMKVIKYREETDPKVLSLMAKNSNNKSLIDKLDKKPVIFSNEGKPLTNYKVSMVKQLLEQRIYNDGFIEKDFVINVIFEPDGTLYFEDTTGKYDMSFILNGYVTEYYEDNGWKRTCTRISTQYTKHGSIPIYVKKNVLEFHGACAVTLDYLDDYVTYNYPSSGVTYTYRPNFTVYVHYLSYLDSTCTYTLTDGTSLTLFVDFLQ